MILSLNCLILGQAINYIFNMPIGQNSNVNGVNIDFNSLTVANFKKLILCEAELKNRGITEVNIWKFERELISLKGKTVTANDIDNVEYPDMMMDPADDLADYFNQKDKIPKKKFLHIVIQPLSSITTNNSELAKKVHFLEEQQTKIQAQQAAQQAEYQAQQAESQAQHAEFKAQQASLIMQLIRSKYTLTSKLDIARLVLDSAKNSDNKFFYDLFAHVEIDSFLDKLDLSSDDLKRQSMKENDVQNKFVKVFSQITGPWTIHDASSKNYFKEPTAKIDFAVLDGVVPSWLQLVFPVEIKPNIGGKAGTSFYNDAIGQLVDRFSHIFEIQKDRKVIVAAIASDIEIELLWGNKQYEFKRSGLLPLNLTDRRSLGLRMLVKLVTASKEILGYISPQMEKDNIEKTVSHLKFKSLIRRRTSERGTFVAVCTDSLSNEDVIFKASADEKELKFLQELRTLNFLYVPEVYLHGILEIGDNKYIVMKPYGESLELSKHGLLTILKALLDIANTIKLANLHNILHRDIKPSNIVLYNRHGYLIDWGIAIHTSDNFKMANDLSATLQFCSLKILNCVVNKEPISNTIDDEIESLFYTLVSIICEGRLCWDKGIDTASLEAFKNQTIYLKFDRQLYYAPEEYRQILKDFHLLIFDSKQRKKIDIETVIQFFSTKIEESQTNNGQLHMEGVEYY